MEAKKPGMRGRSRFLPEGKVRRHAVSRSRHVLVERRERKESKGRNAICRRAKGGIICSREARRTDEW